MKISLLQVLLIVFLTFNCSVFQDDPFRLENYHLQEFHQTFQEMDDFFYAMIYLRDELVYLEDPDNIWKTPLQTLRDGGGDCEDYAVLFAYLAQVYFGRITDIVIIDEGMPYNHAIVQFRDGWFYEPQGAHPYYGQGFELIHIYTLEEALQKTR